ncbi:Na+ dependent nucleoside transporter domain protein [Desulfamplus magnetovallimortis]|uniref:Na+ dependent nucleoside transporter domain protein n=1 Tax=Desulfamplus magnetovallimortis TaxID=1246637 RepID=A0A1W1HAY4_9BACT|nr:nucleoside transporter C-terminal domain-containing protein [Desulfamplus magnetovallimortis]SLM29654.1 Na+ dependent nucleoside transporter domain protein [Desulfamplus magnetovallimortis]
MIFFQAILGLTFFILLPWCMSDNRTKVQWGTIIKGIVIQFALAFILLNIPFFRNIFMSLNSVVLGLQEASKAGTSVVFGYLGGAQLPFDEKFPGSSFIFAFQALPLVLLISAISTLLFYWKILPMVVQGFSWALKKIFKIGGSEGLGISANIFVGMVEAPLFIQPYLSKMTKSEIFSLMTSGMATIAGTVMVLYATILGNTVPDVLGHILVASIISAPAALTVAKIMVPETDNVTISAKVTMNDPPISAMDAISKGTVQGVSLLINIVAMLIVLIALVHIIDLMLGILPDFKGVPLTLQRILGWVMAPVTWLMGVPWHEAHTAGSLMGIKTALNEFLAYLELSKLSDAALSDKSRLIMIYAMCGFANPGSLGIMIGGMGTMAPDKRGEITKLGFRALIAGTIATCMTGTVVGVIITITRIC